MNIKIINFCITLFSFFISLTVFSNSLNEKRDIFSFYYKNNLKSLQIKKLLDKKLIFNDENILLYVDKNAQNEHFDNLFLIRAPTTIERDFAYLSQFGKVIKTLPGEYSLMYIHQDQLANVASWSHRRTQFCGSLIKINNSEVISIQEPLKEPLIKVNQKNPIIESYTSQVDTSFIKETIEKLSSLNNRFDDTESPEIIKKSYEELIKSRSDISIQLIPHSFSKQNSIIVRIEGKKYPDELVIVGSHIDSINSYSNEPIDQARAPGADDNASGTATNLELFRVLMKNNYIPERTIEIHGYAAEEWGLMGSQEIAKSYHSNTKTRVVAMLQNDMNFYKKEGEKDKIFLISNGTSDKLNSYLEKFIEYYTGVPWEYKKLLRGTSDHRSWTALGYHTAFPFEDPENYNSEKIHTEKDTLDGASFTQSAAFTKLSLSFLTHFAGIYETEKN